MPVAVTSSSLGNETLLERMQITLHLGQLLLENGATSYHTHNILFSLSKALECERIHICIAHNAIHLSMGYKDHLHTQSIQCVTDMCANFSAIARLGRLSQTFERRELSIPAFKQQLEIIAQAKPLYPLWSQPGMAGLGCGCVSILFGADGAGFFSAFIGSVLGFIVLIFFVKYFFNPYLVTLVIACITSLCADLTSSWVLSQTPKFAIAASVLFLVPGVPLTCGVLDIVLGYTLSGLGRLAHGFFQCLCIGLGIILALELAGGSII